MSSPASGIVLLAPYYLHREAPQEATGFSPFELLYGRTARGLVQILKELWTGETGITVNQLANDIREQQNRITLCTADDGGQGKA